MKKIALYAHGANPLVDNPLKLLKRPKIDLLIAAGAVEVLPGGCAMYVADRKAFVEQPQKPEDYGYDREVSAKGRRLVWVPSGWTWQMKDSFGGLSRHFEQTGNGLNPSPNRTLGNLELKSYNARQVILPCLRTVLAKGI